MFPRRTSGFTLIELLIVVAIIGILAAIAVPNFLNAQMRARVSRTKADLRSVGTALESYFVDRNNYPNGRDGNDLLIGCPELTTPVAYISSIDLEDTFNNEPGYTDHATVYHYYNTETHLNDRAITWGGRAGLGYGDGGSVAVRDAYILFSEGPDQVWQFCEWFFVRNAPIIAAEPANQFGAFVYDSSNGLVSKGDIGWHGGMDNHGRGAYLKAGAM